MITVTPSTLIRTAMLKTGVNDLGTIAVDCGEHGIIRVGATTFSGPPGSANAPAVVSEVWYPTSATEWVPDGDGWAISPSDPADQRWESQGKGFVTPPSNLWVSSNVNGVPGMVLSGHGNWTNGDGEIQGTNTVFVPFSGGVPATVFVQKTLTVYPAPADTSTNGTGKEISEERWFEARAEYPREWMDGYAPVGAWTSDGLGGWSPPAGAWYDLDGFELVPPVGVLWAWDEDETAFILPAGTWTRVIDSSTITTTGPVTLWTTNYQETVENDYFYADSQLINNPWISIGGGRSGTTLLLSAYADEITFSLRLNIPAGASTAGDALANVEIYLE